MGDKFSGVLHQRLQQLELGGAEVYGRVVDRHRVALSIEDHPTYSDRLWRGRCRGRLLRTPERNPYASHQLTYAEWLGQVVVRAIIEGNDFVFVGPTH